MLASYTKRGSAWSIVCEVHDERERVRERERKTDRHRETELLETEKKTVCEVA